LVPSRPGCFIRAIHELFVERDFLAVADAQSVSARNASAIIDEVAAAVEALPSIASDFGVTRTTLGEVKDATARQLSKS
jgi:hypothetical protein